MPVCLTGLAVAVTKYSSHLTPNGREGFRQTELSWTAAPGGAGAAEQNQTDGGKGRQIWGPQQRGQLCANLSPTTFSLGLEDSNFLYEVKP